MKYLIALTLINSCLFSFGQTNMFWNNYSNFNPAMSGFQYKQHAAITYENSYPSLSGSHTGLKVNYNQRISSKHGVGINFNGDYSSLLNNRITANYNYQFDLNDGGRLSTGIGIGAGRSQYSKVVFGDFPQNYNPTPYNYFNLSFGVAYSWDNLILGVSTKNLFPESDPALSSYGGYRAGFNAHAAYNILLTRKLGLTPSAIFTTESGFHQFGMNLTANFKNKYSLGVSLYNRDNYSANIGLTIKNKIQLAYSFSKTLSKLSNTISGGRHEISIAYVLRDQRFRPGIHGTPAF